MEINKMDDNSFEIVTPFDDDVEEQQKKRKFKPRDTCVRCGSCCEAGTPVLMRDDAPLLGSGLLSYDDLYTVREGELLRERDEEDVYEAAMELIKIRPDTGTGACIFYRAGQGCSIYEHRPIQCRAFKCWSPQEIITGLQESRLTRADFFGSIELLMDAIQRHEEKTSYTRLASAIGRLGENDEAAAEEIIDMLQYDITARPFLAQKLNIPEGALNLVLGSPLAKTIEEFGLTIVCEGDEYTIQPLKAKEQL